ncbi:MAG TPA: HNH endonuclease signature motif containing protein, partial [Euzebyales bacterium]|nr:HNH endonuclease signature motif containing protein [Euzebyales bacterium]
CGGHPGWAPTQATPTVVLRFDVDALADNPAITGVLERLSRSVRGPVHVTTRTAQRILCDAAISLVFTNGSTILGSTATGGRIPTPLRRALLERDGGCRFPGCTTNATQCDAHHIRHRIHDGATTEDNLLLLCSQHHHAIHDGRWAITLHPDRTATFTRRGVTHTTAPRAHRHLHPTTTPPKTERRRSNRTQRKRWLDDKARHQPTAPDPALTGGAAHGNRPPPTTDPDPPLPF